MLRSKLLAALAVTLFIIGMGITGCAQTYKVKTVELKSGEKVLDISGLWDTQIEHYGSYSGYGKFSTVTEIKQKGSSFVGIRKKATRYHQAGSKTFQGELDKNGFKKFQILTRYGAMDTVAIMSDDGKTITTDTPNFVKTIMTRKE